jgi:aubergine-like protein
VENGVPTQVVTMRVVRFDERKLMTVATKIVAQMNTKLGGVPWNIGLPLSGLMTIGFDVYHDSINKRQSYGIIMFKEN